MSAEDLIHSERLGNFTSGEYAMSDKASWRVVITMVLLFCIWLGIRYKERADHKYQVNVQYRSMQSNSDREHAHDLERFKVGLISMPEINARREARAKELHDFWENNRQYID